MTIIFIVLTVSYFILCIRLIIKKRVWIRKLLFLIGMILFSWCSFKISAMFNSLSNKESFRLLIFYAFHAFFFIISFHALVRYIKTKQE